MPATSASVRFRAQWPAKYWDEADVYPNCSRRFGDYDAYIFQKAYLSGRTAEMIRSLRAMGKIMAFDLCDADWLQSGQHRKRLLAVLPLFDFAVAPTDAIRDWLAQWLPAYVIRDRLDLEEFCDHVLDPAEPREPSCIWFGYSHNLVYLAQHWDTFGRVLDEYDLPLTILSDELPAEWASRTWGSGKSPRFVQWTPDGANAEIAKHTIALVPPTTQYKSDNRIATAWALGVAAAQTGMEVACLLDYGHWLRHIGLGAAKIVAEYHIVYSALEWQDLLDRHWPYDHKKNDPTQETDE